MKDAIDFLLELKQTYPHYFWGAVSVISFSIFFIVAIIGVKKYKKLRIFNIRKVRNDNFNDLEKELQERRRIADEKIEKEKKANKQGGTKLIDTQKVDKIVTEPKTAPTPITPKQNLDKNKSTTTPKDNKASNTPPKATAVTYAAQDANDATTAVQVNRRQKTKEQLPEAKTEHEAETTGILIVNYQLNIPESLDKYAILRIPKKGSVVRSHRTGKAKRRGYKEGAFQASIERYFGKQFEVSGEVRLNTGAGMRPFETDIAIIERTKVFNLRIDVEIDEPYAGIDRQPTHCAGDDVMRDIYFIDRGWIVIRFSEHQVHMQEIECLKYIAHIIKSIDPNFLIPADLNTPLNLKTEKVWDTLQAESWEKSNYREQYLEHEFKETPEIPEKPDRGLNRQEQKEEGYVNPTKIGISDNGKAIGYNGENTHTRDRRIRFYPEPHVYVVDGVPFPSASTVISRFFPDFNPEEAIRKIKNGIRYDETHRYWGVPDEEIKKKWKDDGVKAANDGTYLHEQIEKYFLKKNYDRVPEFHLFEQFVKAHESIVPYRSEWRIFDEEYNIAGTIDLLVKNGSDYEIYDWKRSTNIIDYFGNPITENRFDSGKGILRDIPDTSFNKYCLQQSLYRYILEKHYNLKVSKMFLIVLHPEYTQYYKFETPYKKDKVELILKAI